jgi:molecular chaperone DnaK (HSP70)
MTIRCSPRQGGLVVTDRDVHRHVLARTCECIRTVLQRALVTAAEIDVVIRTGGTSEIVAVRALLEELFPDKVEGHDPFTSVACGLAIANHGGHRFADGLGAAVRLA